MAVLHTSDGNLGDTEVLQLLVLYTNNGDVKN